MKKREDAVEYKGLAIVPSPEVYGDRFMIMDGWDYIQEPPFDTVEDAAQYIDGMERNPE